MIDDADIKVFIIRLWYPIDTPDIMKRALPLRKGYNNIHNAITRATSCYNGTRQTTGSITKPSLMYTQNKSS